MSNYTIDLNCDLGESFGAYRLGNDKEIISLVSSVNVACGFHAGDPTVMKRTVKLALEKGVAIGAHPGLPDLAGFGRRQMAVSPEEVHDMILYQVGALSAFVKAEGEVLHHVKPHGALYNMAANDKILAEAIAEAIYRFNPELILYGLAGSELIKAGEKLGLLTAQEAFADRSYQQDGTLSPRQQPGAVIGEVELAVGQVIRMAKEGKVRTLEGKEISLKADTICIHGDGAYALEFATSIHRALISEGIKVEALAQNS